MGAEGQWARARVKAKHPLPLRLPDHGGIGVLCPEGQRPGSIPAWGIAP